MADGPPSWALTRDVLLVDGVAVDRLVVHGPNALVALESSRAIWETYRLRILDAPKGAGKTYALARLTRGRRLICMTDRVALVEKLAAQFGAEFRLPMGSDPEAIREQANGDRLALTIHAAGRLRARSMGNDVLVMDEAIHCLGTLANGRELRGWQRGRVAAALSAVFAEAREAWLAQAAWTAGDVKALATMVSQAGRVERILHVVVVAPEQRGAAVEAPSAEALRDLCLTAAQSERAFFASASRTACEALAQEASRLGLNPLVVTSRTMHTARVQAWLANPTPEAEPFVIASPSVVSGLSIDTRDGRAAYPSVFLDFPTWPGGLALDDALQFVCRVRGTTTLRWWASAQRIAPKEADERYADEAATAESSAMVLGVVHRAGTMLDALAAERAAAGEASLWPVPRVALAEGLARDGWTVETCEPEAASEESASRWREAKQAAAEAYLSALADPNRGPADQRTVEARLRELGRQDEEEALAEVLWLEREHRRGTPVDLLVAALSPETVRPKDEAEQRFACRADMRHDVQAGDLVRALLDAANADRGKLSAGLAFEVRMSDLGAFAELARRHEAVLHRLLGIEAPRGPRGATRAFLTLVDRLGGERLGGRRAGAERERSYSLRLHPIALGALIRRGGVPQPILPAGSTGLFPRTAEDALAARVPMRLLPEATEAVPAVEARAAESEGPERARLERAAAVLRKAVDSNGLLWAQGVAREDSGRIHLRNAPLQTLPRSVRHLIVPDRPGDVFVSADLRSAHLAVAAVLTGDEALQELLATPDAYDQLARRFLPDASDGRSKMKVAVLALLNGAGAGKIGEIVGTAEIGRRMRTELLAALPGLRRCMDEARRLHPRDGAVAEVPTLTGRVRHIKKAVGDGGWRRLLSGMWSCVEAEALDHVLANLPIGARACAPMFDGLFVCCAAEDAERVARELRAAMKAGARAAGFEAGVKVGVGTTWAQAEEGAR